jgi:hypothetical protein
MKRLRIYILDNWDPALQLEEELVFEPGDYSRFIDLMKEADIYSEFCKGITITCDLCGSFCIPTRKLYEILATIEKRIDFDTCEFFDLDFPGEILRRLLVPVTLTDEEWGRYLEGKIALKELDPGVDPIYECDGFRYICEECAFNFDVSCTCKSVMEG